MRSSQRQADRRARGVARSVAALGVPVPSRTARVQHTPVGQVPGPSGSPLVQHTPGGRGQGAELGNNPMLVLLTELNSVINRQVAEQVAAALQGIQPPSATTLPPKPLEAPASASASVGRANEVPTPDNGQTAEDPPEQAGTSGPTLEQGALGECPPSGQVVAVGVWGASQAGSFTRDSVNSETVRLPSPTPAITTSSISVQTAQDEQQAAPVQPLACKDCRTCDCTFNPTPCRACRTCECQLPPTRNKGPQGVPAQEGIAPITESTPGKSDGTPPAGLYAPSYAPLAWHLAPAVREKIAKGEYVDMFSLMLREPEPAPKEGDCPGAQRGGKRVKIDRNWENWECGYMAFAGVILTKEPNKGMMLFKYFDLINKIRKNHGGAGWDRYDSQFRMRASEEPHLSWFVKDHEIWSQLVVANREEDDWAPSGHIITKSGVSRPFSTPAKQRVQTPGICFLFNSQGGCHRQGCPYQHACSGCGGHHPSKFCGKGKMGKNWKRGGQGKKQGGDPSGGASNGALQPHAQQGAKSN